MKFAIRNRVRECKPIPLFEELEERIVLDASVDSDISGHALDASHASQAWNLEYSSDPSVSITPVLNTSELAGYKATLDTVTWVDPFGGTETHIVTDAAPQTVNLGGRFVVGPDPTPADGVEVIINGPNLVPPDGWSSFVLSLRA